MPIPRRGAGPFCAPITTADHLGVQLVGLDVLGIDLALLDVEFMEALGVLAGPLFPVGDGALVQAVGRDDRLARAAVAEQGQDEGDEVEGLVPAVVRGVPGCGEGLPAGGAAEAPFLVGVDADVALAGQPPMQAREVGAELERRVHCGSLRGSGDANTPEDTQWTRSS